MKKRILPVVIVLSMIIATIPMLTYAANVVEVTTFDALKTALTSEVSGETIDNPTIVVLKNSVIAPSEIGINGTPKFKALVADGNYTISREQGDSNNPGNLGFIFQIRDGSVFNLGGVIGYNGVITIDGANPLGKYPWTSPGICNSIFYMANGAVLNMYSGVLTNNKTDSGNGTIKLEDSTANLFGGTISNASTTNQWCDGGAIYMTKSASTSHLLIDGVSIINNYAGNGGAIKCNYGHIVMNSGLIKGNGGTNIIDISSNDVANPASFDMYGGTIEELGGTYTSGKYVMQFSGLVTANFYGGTIKNTYNSAMFIKADSTNCPVVNFAAQSGGNGITMQNCGYDGTNVTAIADNYGGCIFNDGCTLNISAGTFKDCRSVTQYFNGFINNGGNGNLTITGGTFTGCDIAVKHTGATFSIGGNPSFSKDDEIDLPNDKTLQIISNLTTSGAVATLTGNYVTNGHPVLSGDAGLISANAGKFAALLYDNTTYCGVNTSGQADTSLTAPTFGGSTPPEPAITLGFTGTAATVNSNVAIPSAELIVASYNASGNLVDVESFPVAVEANVALQETLTGFNSGSKVKVMLWDSLDTIKPLTDVFVQ